VSARFASILHQLHLVDDPPRSLNIGCGDFPEFKHLRDHRPAWTHIGLDPDLNALRRASHASPRLCADGVRLPFAITFSLLVIRHPDVARNRAAWQGIFVDVPQLLARDALLLVTSYDLDEIEFAQQSIRLRYVPLNEARLAPPDLAGRDRFALVFRRD
jgi:hypothetical protein